MVSRISIIVLLALVAMNQASAASRLLDLLSELTRIIEKQPMKNYVKICRRSDPQLNKCVGESIEAIKPYLANGVPELGLPGCEPLRLSEITTNQGKGKSTLQSRYRNVEISGPSQFALISASLDMTKDSLKLKLWMPELHVKSDYSINGNVLSSPILASGDHQANFTDVDVLAELQFERTSKGGGTYLHVKNSAVEMQIGHASVYFSGLFDGQKILDVDMNQFFKENWHGVADEMKPVLEKTLAGLFRTYSNRIFSKYTLDTLLPP